MIERAISQRHRRSSLTTTMRNALTDPNLLGHALDEDSWQTWRALLIAAMGETLTPAERRIFKQITGRSHEPKQRVEELVGVIGRRGGKSRAIAALSVFLSCLCDYRHVLARGEKGILLVIAPDQRQATVVLNYAAAAMESSPFLHNEVINHTANSLTLRNGTSIEVRAASFRRLRGPTYIGVIADEAAFWKSDESANPDQEIINAVRPGLATTGGPLIVISSPYARRGLLWETYKRHFGPQGDKLILVAQGSTRTFNPSLAQHIIDRAYERDPIAAAAEFGGEFRSDIESFISLDVVEACVSAGIHERPPIAGVRMSAFVDPSGGSADSFTLAIGYRDSKGMIVLCALREVKPPFSPEGVVAEFAALLKTYKVSKVVGDRFAGEWPREQFRKHSISYEPSAKPKSDLYRDLLPLLNSRKIDLLDNRRLAQQLVGLERRTARSGKDSIDHAPNSHDDLANVAAGVASLCTGGSYDTSYSWVCGDTEEGSNEDWRRLRLAAFISCGGKVRL